MKMLLTSLGTRGDMEPHLAVGMMLKEKGHEVICQFPEQFRALVEDSGLEFETLGSEMVELMEGNLSFTSDPSGITWQRIQDRREMARRSIEARRLMIDRQFEAIGRLNPDRIIHNARTMFPLLYEAQNPGRVIYLSPLPCLHYVKGHSHVLLGGRHLGEFLNKLTYKLYDMRSQRTIMSAAKRLDIPGITKQQITDSLTNQKVIYTISPQLFERPADWGENMHVVGYYERDKASHWEPDEALLGFLARHAKMVLVTFGSMTNSKPLERTSVILEILKRHRIPAVINTLAGGLVEPETCDRELFHFVSCIPYDWLFPRMYAVIHHGGSGTLHMATRCGCPSLIIPHMLDQLVWNQVVHEKGLGPKGVIIGRITKEKLEPRILELLNNEEFKKNAEEIARRMNDEMHLAERLYDVILK